jgi:hypothetical protein
VRGREPAVDESELVLEVADRELDVRRRSVDLPDEIRLDTEQFGVRIRVVVATLLVMTSVVSVQW